MDIKYHRWLIAQYWLVLETEHFNEQCYLFMHELYIVSYLFTIKSNLGR